MRRILETNGSGDAETPVSPLCDCKQYMSIPDIPHIKRRADTPTVLVISKLEHQLMKYLGIL